MVAKISTMKEQKKEQLEDLKNMGKNKKMS